MLPTRKKSAAPEASPVAALRAEVEKIAAERAGLAPQTAQLAERIEALENQHPAAVLKSDADAEANEAERRRLGYAQARLAARLAELEAAEADARQRLAEAEAAQAKAEAERAVAAVVAELATVYTPAVETIAAFIDRWKDSQRLANAAGVDGPETVGRPRRCDREGVPPRYEEQTYEAFVDVNGNPTDGPMGLDAHGNRTVVRQRRTFTREVRVADSISARYLYLPPLDESIVLPPATWGAPSINPPALTVREWNE